MASHSSSSRTQVQEEPVRVLHLRPSSSEAPRAAPRVRWTEDVVDNEDMGKKKSKICCIFHPQKEFGESSDESSSSSSSDSSDSEAEAGAKKPCCDHSHKQDKKTRKSKPNAYETQPHYKNKSVVPTP